MDNQTKQTRRIENEITGGSSVASDSDNSRAKQQRLECRDGKVLDIEDKAIATHGLSKSNKISGFQTLADLEQKVLEKTKAADAETCHDASKSKEGIEKEGISRQPQNLGEGVVAMAAYRSPTVADLENGIHAKVSAGGTLHARPTQTLIDLEDNVRSKQGGSSGLQNLEGANSDGARDLEDLEEGIRSKASENEGKPTAVTVEVPQRWRSTTTNTTNTRNGDRAIPTQQPGAYAEVGGMRLNNPFRGMGSSNSDRDSLQERTMIHQTSNMTMASSAASANLAEASPVQDDGQHHIPRAIEQSKDMLELAAREKKRKFLATLGVAIVLFLVVIVATAITIGLIVSEKDAKVLFTQLPVSQSPTEAPTLSLDSQIMNMLSRHAIEFEPPQYTALEWLLADPLLTTYPEWRVCQRFALAAFYYSTGGPTWTRNDGWLNYSLHECEWYSSESFLVHFSYINVTYPGPCEEDPDDSDAQGIYQHLRFRDNNLQGTLPMLELSMLPSLRSINVQGNQIVGTLSSHVGRLRNLEALSLVSNSISGNIPSELGLLSSATGMWMFDNHLEGTVPTELAQMIKMESMMLDINSLTGPVPGELSLLPNLVDLVLADNQLTGMIPTELGLMPNIAYLSLDGNLLTGTIPSNFQQMTSLEFLFLNRNSLTGTLPPDVIGSLTNATILSLFGNQFLGPIPTEFGLLSHLGAFSLYDNDFSGSIPSEFGLLGGSLGWMLIHNNQIQYSIPSELGLLKNLTRFTAQQNNLSGEVPIEFSELQFLEELNIAGNMLETVPSDVLILCAESCDCPCHQQNASNPVVQNHTSAHNASM
ncbi:Leucine Rich Repeat [Seminavis robusta]|uniref:Leucine Rich Repeat n=1 Tax=Seminavis robusta TaxID=568900 RepID=A0A9N8DA20_9STRA|nr:Leucine Rich Repeat [Seminavis robusta]|eukprot:Sro47_g027840.1 Leucine Rich Repeat (819) ;mRNA; r:79357-82322